MSVMHVGRMRMLVPESRMNVSMGMGLPKWIRIGMVMPMVCIMAVRMRVPEEIRTPDPQIRSLMLRSGQCPH